MALSLAPETEERLRSVAVLRGQDPETALDTLLQYALTEAEAEAETIRARLQASEDEFNRAGGKTLEEWTVDIMAQRSQRASGQS